LSGKLADNILPLAASKASASQLRLRLPIDANGKCYPLMESGNQRMNFVQFPEIHTKKVQLRKEPGGER